MVFPGKFYCLWLWEMIKRAAYVEVPIGADDTSGVRQEPEITAREREIGKYRVTAGLVN